MGIIGTSGVGQRTSDKKKRVKLRKIFVSSVGSGIHWVSGSKLERWRQHKDINKGRERQHKDINKGKPTKHKDINKGRKVDQRQK